MKTNIGILLVCTWFFCGVGAAEVVVDLSGEVGHLAYDGQPFPHFRMDRLKNGFMGPPV